MRRPGSVFLFGMVLLVIGASITIDLLADLQLPRVQGLIAVVMMVWGARLVGNAWEVTGRGSHRHGST